MRFLLTNDDGIGAPGIAALEAALEPLGRSTVFAPNVEQSGCSHQTTTDRMIRLRQTAPGRVAVEGTPADCVRVGLHRLDSQIDFVMAGVNAGGNLGADIYHSGTVAAVREGVLHGVPGIAVSHYRNRKLTAADWSRATAWIGPLLVDLLSRPAAAGALWNINLPCPPNGDDGLPEVVFCPPDPSPLPLEFREEADGGLHYSGVYRNRPRAAGCDVDVCFSGKIAISEVRLF